MARNKTGLEKALSEIPALARGVLEERPRARRRPDEPDPRAGRPRGRLLRARRAHGARRARTARSPAAATSARRARPRTARPCATTSEFAHVAAWEWSGRAARRSATRSRSTFEQRPPDPALATSRGRPNRCTSRSTSGARPAPTPPAPWRPTTPPTSPRRCRFLEMLDIVNERLNAEGREPIAFEHDCREGICGTCGMMINGQAHGPQQGTATCQLHMRKFADGDEIFIEPWRAAAFPVLKDLVVDRAPFDQIVEAGGYITAPTGAAPDANLTLDPEGGGRRGDGRGRLHRLRRLRGRLPEQRRPAVHLGQAQPPQPAAAGPGRALPAHAGDGRHDGGSSSAPARTTASARRRARRRSRSTSSPT